MSLPSAMKIPCHGCPQSVVVLQSFVIESLTVAAIDSPRKVRLLGDQNVILGHEAICLLRRRHGEVLQIVAMIFSRESLESIHKHLQRHFDGSVSDRMKAELPAHLVRVQNYPAQLLFTVVQFAEVVWTAAVEFKGIGGWTCESAVNQNLDYTDT